MLEEVYRVNVVAVTVPPLRERPEDVSWLLERFFDHVTTASGMAYVVVQHLSPDFRSLMDELIARHSKMPVVVVEDGTKIAPNHIYLLPPRKEMIVRDRRVK